MGLEGCRKLQLGDKMLCLLFLVKFCHSILWPKWTVFFQFKSQFFVVHYKADSINWDLFSFRVLKPPYIFTNKSKMVCSYRQNCEFVYYYIVCSVTIVQAGTRRTWKNRSFSADIRVTKNLYYRPPADANTAISYYFHTKSVLLLEKVE